MKKAILSLENQMVAEISSLSSEFENGQGTKSVCSGLYLISVPENS